jgi:hypothetical protein
LLFSVMPFSDFYYFQSFKITVSLHLQDKLKVDAAIISIGLIKFYQYGQSLPRKPNL